MTNTEFFLLVILSYSVGVCGGLLFFALWLVVSSRIAKRRERRELERRRKEWRLADLATEKPGGVR